MDWTYFVATSETDPEDIEQECKQAGKHGWELVSAIVAEATPDEFRTRLIFKKPVD